MSSVSLFLLPLSVGAGGEYFICLCVAGMKVWKGVFVCARASVCVGGGGC